LTGAGSRRVGVHGRAARLGGALAATLLAAGCALDTTAARIARADPAATVTARGETVPVRTVGDDAADDPAIWRNAADPAASLVVGTDKKDGLYVYGLDGAIRHFFAAGAVNNVDLLPDASIAGARGVLVAASDRNDLAAARIALFRLETASGVLTPLGKVDAGAGEAYGICLYRLGEVPHAFVVLKDGGIQQVALDLAGAAPSGRIVRRLKLGTQSEGCAVDARTGRLYVAEEDVGLWRFDAAPGGSTTPVRVGAVDGRRLVADAEGVALAPRGERGGYVIVSSQGDNAYSVYRLDDDRYVGRFRIGAGRLGATEETDGIDLVLGDFGPTFPGGLLVVQDGVHDRGAQNFKLVAWDDVARALGLEP
jgi:3-phytase